MQSYKQRKEAAARRKELAAIQPGDVVEIRPGVRVKIIKNVNGGAVLADLQASQDEQARKGVARHARYEKTDKGVEARRRALDLRNADPVRRAHHNALNDGYRERKRIAHSNWPFCPIDAEGVNMLSECWSVTKEGDRIDRHFLAWISDKTQDWVEAENKVLARRKRPKLDWAHLNGEDWDGDRLNPNSQRVWIEYVKATGFELYMPQKLVVLAAGVGDKAVTLTHAEGGLGRDAPALSMIECFDFLCDLRRTHPRQFYVMYGSGYDFSEIMRGLPEPVAWEIQNQMAYTNKDVELEERDEPNVQRVTFFILKRPDGEATQPGVSRPAGAAQRHEEAGREPGKEVAFGINYLKGKWFKIGRISNVPDIRPPEWPWVTIKGGMSTLGYLNDDTTERVPFDYADSRDSGMTEIHDTISFFQESFINALDGMKSSIEVSAEDRDLIDWGKPKRGVFADELMGKIIAYNQAELNTFEKMMDAYRVALKALGVNLRDWYGPGCVAKALLKQKGILPDKWKGVEGHYPEWLRASGHSVAQDWSHFAFSGGCIDLMRQGVHQDAELPIYEYDLTSIYPYIISTLPSMFGGKYKALKKPKKALTLDELKALVAGSNMLSMFEIEWNFKEHVELDEAARLSLPLRETGPQKGVWRETSPPFYPFFYRTNGTKAGADLWSSGASGGLLEPFSMDAELILYPPHGRGRYYRDEVLAAIAWCERFPWAVKTFEYRGAQVFHPKDADLRPFAFVQELFDRRAEIIAETKTAKMVWEAGGCVGDEPYNLLEKVIKLILNSIYGKTAQSLGEVGYVPIASNPFYAGAITAGCRAMLHTAALKDSWRVIAFATDAITSAGPMRGLEHTSKKVLGTWEHAKESATEQAAIFLHPGFNSYFDLKSQKENTKMRGCKVEFGRDFLSRDVRKAWKEGNKYYVTERRGEEKQEVSFAEWRYMKDALEERFAPYPAAQKRGKRLWNSGARTHEPENKLSMPATYLVTFGASLASEETWPKCGTWRTCNRDLDLNACGIKRKSCEDKARADCLVFVPAQDHFETDILCKPYYPQWLDDETKEVLLEQEGAEAAAMRFEE